MANFDRRPRGRNNNRRNGRRHNGARPSQVIKLNDQGRSFNHQRVGFNGNASKLFEKYNKLASEALASGDKILAENYFQHADHFARMIPPPEEMKSISEENKDEETTSAEERSIEDKISKESDLNKVDGDSNTVVAKSSD